MITNSTYLNIFSRKFCLTVAALSIPFFQTTFIILNYYVFKCCRFTFNPLYYSFEFVKPPVYEFNYVDHYILKPFFICGFIIPVFCYLRIFFITRKSTKAVVSGVKNQKKRRQARTLEFTIIFVFYLMLYVGMEFGQYLPTNIPHILTAIGTICGMTDATAISLVQIRNIVLDYFKSTTSSEVSMVTSKSLVGANASSTAVEK